MHLPRFGFLGCACLVAGCWNSSAPGQVEPAPFVVTPAVGESLERYCFDCHRGEMAEGGVRLDQLAQLTGAARLELLSQVENQLAFDSMPPEDAVQPDAPTRQQLVEWVSAELEKQGASNLDEKLRHPSYGNLIDHDLLFSGEIQSHPFTPARRWLVSPQIFHERVNDVFQLTGRSRQSRFYGVTNPFVLPDRSGVRDYDLSVLDGGHLLVMLNNAQWISEKQIFGALHHGQNRREVAIPNPKDRWYPSTSPEAWVAIVNQAEPPSRAEMVAAIEAQFQCVLQRPPTETETLRYLDLLRSTVELGGNVEGLRQMLFSVLLESEFLYRQEFGAGPMDAYGRKKLSPREAAQAIAYALGDQGPDEELRQAAIEGRLSTKEDFRREVTRLLDDDSQFFGPVDPGLSGKNMKSHTTSHPKLVRFFREFFGYPGATKIFKDQKRSGGYYQNPARGTAGSPGFLIKEADRVVDWVLEHDRNVFENLLTTDQYFVYHDRDNETGKAIIAEFRDFYEHFKDTNWKSDPEQVMQEHEEYLQSLRWVRVPSGKQKREFLRHMYFFSETIGKGRTPFTTVSFAHGYTYNHSPFYNLPPTPGVFRYGGVERENFGGLEDVEFWDYPVEQPFRIANRRGLLTHPAWLVAHSSNFHTDPIKRGRWIREKLLAGHVPEVPITVDATVPEDPHRTFGERVRSVTRGSECWKCHQHMNPLGMPLEVFDDFGRYRLDEPLEYPEQLISSSGDSHQADAYRTRRVSTDGELSGTGNPELDGPVADPFELIDRLARSDRVRQSIIRHAFRFFMGRNEMLSDSPTLIAADKAYLASGGSFRAVVVSLLTSDSFRYRKPASTPPGD